MHPSAGYNSFPARIMLAGIWGVICAAILAAPILVSHACPRAASVLYFCFSCICHQIPERSFMILGYPLAVCHRCFGIYIGLFLGSLIENRFVHKSPQARRFWVMASGVPLMLDVFLPCAGLWSNTNLSRFLTGLLFGSLISPILACGVAEFLNETSQRRWAIGDVHLKGGVS